MSPSQLCLLLALSVLLMSKAVFGAPAYRLSSNGELAKVSGDSDTDLSLFSQDSESMDRVLARFRRQLPQMESRRRVWQGRGHRHGRRRGRLAGRRRYHIVRNRPKPEVLVW